MERVPLHDREMEISIQYHVMLIRQSNDQILMRCYIIVNMLQDISRKLNGVLRTLRDDEPQAAQACVESY